MNYTDEQKARLFDALEMDGVDNWEGHQIEGGNYEEVLLAIEAEEKFDEVKKKCEPLVEIIEQNIEVDYPAGRDAGVNTALSEDGLAEAIMWISKNLMEKK